MWQFFRDILHDGKYLFIEANLKLKHPKRPCDFWRHVRGLYSTIIGHPWYCLKRGVRNLWIWVPTIWKNDVYDYTYLTKLMDLQMKEMEDFFLSDIPHLQKAKVYGKRIRWTRKLYQMWISEYYGMTHYDKHHEKWDKEKHNSFFDPLNSVACEWDEWGEPTVFTSTCKMSDEERAEYSEGSNKAHKMDKKVFDLWHKNLKYIPRYWD